MMVATDEHGDWVPNEGNCESEQPLVAAQNSKYNNQTKNNDKFLEIVLDKPTSSVRDMFGPTPNPEKQNALPKSTNLAPVTCNTSLLDCSESFTKKPIKAGVPISGPKQFWILLKSTFRSILRDQAHSRLCTHTVVGLLIGLLYFDIGADGAKVKSNTECIYCTVMFTMFTVMLPTILTFPIEISVIMREHSNDAYFLKAFFFAKTLADLPFQIVFSSVYVIIVYFMTGQPLQTDRVFMFMAINILAALVAQSLGFLIGAVMKIEIAVYLGPITTLPLMLLSGFYLHSKTTLIYLQWLTYLNYVKYGFEGAILSVYGYGRENLHCLMLYCPYSRPNLVLAEMNMDKANFWIDFGALSAFFVCIRLVSYLVLRFKLKIMQ